MPAFSVIKDTIYDVINGLALVTDGNIEYQYQNSPHPNKPYFSLLLTSFLKVGRDAFTHRDASGKADMVGNREFTLMILGFGPDIIEKTYQMQTQFETDAIHLLFKAGGILPFNIDNAIQDISGLDDSENEERSSYDILMRTDSVITNVPVGAIEIVNAEGTFSQAGKDDIVQTINVDST